jgi:hypothetical protein
MDVTAAESPDPNSTAQKPQANPEQNSSPARSVDKYAEARSAKRKKRRTAHRARIKRAHANG